MKPFTLSAVVFLSIFGARASLANWEGSHIDVEVDNRAADWWYIQVLGQTAAPNGNIPSLELVIYHGNPFEFGPTNNNPLYSVSISGFDNDGLPFANTVVFNSSEVFRTPSGDTVGQWGDNGLVFTATPDRNHFNVTMNNSYATGMLVMTGIGEARTGCGGTNPEDDPFFDSLVSDNRPLTNTEEILYKHTGWRITIPGGVTTVDLVIAGKPLQFTGAGYKDSTWSTNAINDFIDSRFIMISQVGPWSLIAFSGKTLNGTNLINVGHLSYNGVFLTSQCNIIGERTTDISIIVPSGNAISSGVGVPTDFDLTFVLANSSQISFHATNIAENPSLNIYHRWTANFTGGVEGESFQGYGLTEWINTGLNPQYQPIV